jgi:hypothetical protein
MLRLLPRRRFNAANRADGQDAADETSSSSAAASADRSCAIRTFFFTNVERRDLDQTGSSTILDGSAPRSTRGWRRRLSRAAGDDRDVSQSR